MVGFLSCAQRIWHSGTGKGYNQPMSQNCFLWLWNAQKSWSKELGQQSNLHVRMSLLTCHAEDSLCISGLVFFSTVFWIMKSELIRAMDSSKWNENRSFCLRRGGFGATKKETQEHHPSGWSRGFPKVWSAVAAAWRGVRCREMRLPSQSHTCVKLENHWSFKEPVQRWLLWQ